MTESIISVTYRGRRYRIPVDEYGFVPVHALVQRFQQCGSVRDLNDNDSVLFAD